MAKELVGPRPGNPGIEDGEEAWIARYNLDFKLTREAGVPRVEEKKGRVTRTSRCKGYFAGKSAQGAESSETPLSAVNVTSLFYDHFYFGKADRRKNIFRSPGACRGGGSRAWGGRAGRRPWQGGGRHQVC